MAKLVYQHMNAKLFCFLAEQTSLAKMRAYFKKGITRNMKFQEMALRRSFASAVSRMKKMQIQSAEFALMMRGYHREEEAALLRIAHTPQKYL